MIIILLSRPLFLFRLNLGSFLSSIIRFFHFKVSSELFRLPGHNSVSPQILNAFRSSAVRYSVDPLFLPRKADTILILAYQSWLPILSRTKVEGKIIVGPNFTHLPTDIKDRSCRDMISSYIVPSLWVKNLYKQDLSVSSHRSTPVINVWPSPPSQAFTQSTIRSRSSTRIILYLKLRSFDNSKLEISQTYQLLSNYSDQVRILRYGFYKRRQFISELSRSTLMVILTDFTESQCISQFESWQFGVTTLIKTVSRHTINTLSFDKASSSPWCLPELGSNWDDLQELEKLIPRYLSISRSDVLTTYNRNYETSKLYSQLIKLCAG